MGSPCAALLIVNRSTLASNSIMWVSVRGSWFSNMERVTLDASNELSWPTAAPPPPSLAGGLTGVSKFDQRAAQIPVSHNNVELAATRNLEAHHKPRLLPEGRSFGGDIPAWRRADRHRTNGGRETQHLGLVSWLSPRHG